MKAIRVWEHLPSGRGGDATRELIEWPTDKWGECLRCSARSIDPAFHAPDCVIMLRNAALADLAERQDRKADDYIARTRRTGYVAAEQAGRADISPAESFTATRQDAEGQVHYPECVSINDPPFHSCGLRPRPDLTAQIRAALTDEVCSRAHGAYDAAATFAYYKDFNRDRAPAGAKAMRSVLVPAIVEALKK